MRRRESPGRFPSTALARLGPSLLVVMDPGDDFLVYLDSIDKRLLVDSARMTGCTAPNASLARQPGVVHLLSVADAEFFVVTRVT